jgi:hypothetical protein
MDKVEGIFSGIEFESVVPLLRVLAVGFMAATSILMGEIILKYALSKVRSCTLSIKK